MSSISMDVPTLKISGDELENFLSFLYKNESILKEFGAIKIQLNIDCKLGLKRRRTNILLNPTNEKLVPITNDSNIYKLIKLDNIHQTSIEQNFLNIDEKSFWSSLSSSTNIHSNMSILSDMSLFCRKSAKKSFDIHRLPNQSLLKLAGTKLTRSFVPCLNRAHGSCSIFPLRTTEDNLLSLNYHHEGGIHHWYIIPQKQIHRLKNLINQYDSAICIDHGKLFIDPTTLDKSNIRYHRILQNPNEFVVLYSGSFYQSFTYDASWSENISFALPSWILDSYYQSSYSNCSCHLKQISLFKTIDSNVFRHELIIKYINSHLLNHSQTKYPLLKDYNDIDLITIPTPNSNETTSSNEIGETSMLTYPRLPSPDERIFSSIESPSTSMVTSSVNNYLLDDDNYNNNSQFESNLFEDAEFDDITDLNYSEMDLIDSIEIETRDNENMNKNLLNNSNLDNSFLSFEDFIDLIPSNTIDQTIQHLTNENSSSDNKPIENRNKKEKEKEKAHILFVSGLRSNVTKNDLRKYFIGTKKVVIKQYRTREDLKYAFIYHYTSKQASINLTKNSYLKSLGTNYHIEYSNSNSNCFNYGKRKLMIAKIPLNVHQQEISNLFLNSHLLQYSPARLVKNPKSTKLIWGYAFICYDNEEEAVNVLKRADQYKINDQPLAISVYRKKDLIK